MARTATNSRGQSSLPDYVVTFFVVVAALTAMTIYIQRSIQAKFRDSKEYMVTLAAKECTDDNCRAAAEGGVTDQYEPYYGNVDSTTSRNSDVKTGLSGGSGKRYYKLAVENTETDSYSEQLLPKDAR